MYWLRLTIWSTSRSLLYYWKKELKNVWLTSMESLTRWKVPRCALSNLKESFFDFTKKLDQTSSTEFRVQGDKELHNSIDIDVFR